MPKQIAVHRCLIISPGDVTSYRNAVEGALDAFNKATGQILNVRVDPVRWERDAYPQMGDRPQEILNRQIVDGCDFGVAIFWTRVGSPTGKYSSGSVEEIEELLERGAQVFVYFCAAPIPQELIGTNQFEQVRTLKASLQSRGLYWEFATADELVSKLNAHLMRYFADLELAGHSESAKHEDNGPLALPVPKILVTTTIMEIVSLANAGRQRQDPREKLLKIEVQNHSPFPFFQSSISFKLSDGRMMWIERDHVSKQVQVPVRIEPGDSYSFWCDAGALALEIKDKEILCAVAYDKIGRAFSSKDGELQEQLAKLRAELLKDDSTKSPSGG